MGKADNKRNGLLDYLFQQSISLLLGLFVTGVFAWSVAYLAFGYQDEMNELGDISFKSQTLDEDLKDENKMLAVCLHGWFSTPDHMDKQNAYIHYLTEHATEPQLDQKFYSEALDWYDESITQLYQEKGEIAGYQFHQDIATVYQQGYLDYYTAQITILQSMIDLIVNWDHESQVERRGRIFPILTQFHEFESSMYKLDELGDQLISQNKFDLKQLKDELADLLNKTRQAMLKRDLAIGGVMLGIVLLVFLVWYGIKSQGNKKDAVAEVRGANSKKQKR